MTGTVVIKGGVPGDNKFVDVAQTSRSLCTSRAESVALERGQFFRIDVFSQVVPKGGALLLLLQLGTAETIMNVRLGALFQADRLALAQLYAAPVFTDAGTSVIPLQMNRTPEFVGNASLVTASVGPTLTSRGILQAQVMVAASAGPVAPGGDDANDQRSLAPGGGTLLVALDDISGPGPTQEAMYLQPSWIERRVPVVG